MAQTYITLVLLTLAIYNVGAHQYDGTSESWARYSKWNLCPNDDATLYVTFKTNRSEGVLVYMDDGKARPTDYLLVQLRANLISLEYKFGTGNNPARFTRKDKTIAIRDSENDNGVSILIDRRRMALILAIDTDPGTNAQIPDYGSDLCFGDCQTETCFEESCQNGLHYALSDANSDLFIGGLPPNLRATSSLNLTRQFVGEIYDVEYKNCKCSQSNAVVRELGQSVKIKGDCLNKTQEGCVCRGCECNHNCRSSCPKRPVIEYSLDFDNQADELLINNHGLDAEVFGNVIIPGFPMKYLRLGDRAGQQFNTYAQFAGISQRDECLGNLGFCTQGYTISFWMVILNDDLEIRDGVFINNGGYDSHGIAVYWQDNALHTKFRKPNGDTWKNVAYELYPAQIYYSSNRFVDYWYHFAASWSETNGLQVYLNGESVGTSANPSREKGEAEPPSPPAIPNIRQGFMLGSNLGGSNQFGIARISFASEYRTQAQIIGLGGPRHYFFSMNRVDGSRLISWPSSLNAIVRGTVQMVQGRSDMALTLGRLSSGGQSYVDAGNVDGTCFSAVKTCDIYISFWLRCDQLQGGMTILDTGKSGISIQYQDSMLVVLLYTLTKSTAVQLSYGGLRQDRWYFVEVDRNAFGSSRNNLWINGQIVSSASGARRLTTNYRHNGDTNNLLIGKHNSELTSSYPMSGRFTIDQLDMFQGNREQLLKIGHIQRGIPPHILYTMDGLQNGYLRYLNRSIQHAATAEIMDARLGGYQFVPGRDMMALSLSGSTFEITQRRRNEECYNNLEKCVHGILVRGWFNMETLRQNAGFMSTGFNGIDMAYENGRLVVTADTLTKKWRIDASDIPERKWMFLEISFHPKYGLIFYKDKKKIQDSIIFSNVQNQPPFGASKFVVGGSNDANKEKVPMVVDDLEIWYADRDYVCSLQLDDHCGDGNRAKHYIIDFDEWDPRSFGQGLKRLSHEELIIPANGDLNRGIYAQALTVNGRDKYAEVTEFKPSGLVSAECFGNLSMCSSGYTVSFYLNPEVGSLSADNQPTFILSTGTNGIDVYYQSGILYAKAKANGRVWQVNSPIDYLVEGSWNKIIVAWSPVKGLVLANDERMYIVSQDMVGEDMPGQDTDNGVDVDSNSRFLIGKVIGRTRALRAAFDEMIIEYEYVPPRLGPIKHDSFSFERNHLVRNKVEHPKFDVWLMNGAGIKEGYVGNTTQLNAIQRQYVNLGDHTDTCIDDLDKCRKGITLSFRLKRDRASTGEVILSGKSYDISTEGNRIKVKLMTEDMEWDAESYSIVTGDWAIVDVSWTPNTGLKVYVNDELNVEDTTGRPLNRVSPGPWQLLVGRANNEANRRYFNGEIDEIHFYQASRDELVKKGIIPQPTRCSIIGLIIPMDTINGNRVANRYKEDVIVHNNPRVVDGLIDNGIQLEAYQYIDVGSRLSCQSRPNDCANGFTMRFAMKPVDLLGDSYPISSNPAEVYYGTDGNLHVRYNQLITGTWESMLSGFENGVWYTIDLSWDDENGMTVYVNNEQKTWLQKSTSAITNFDQSSHFYVNKPSSASISSYEYSQFVVDDLQIWDAKLELLRACSLLPLAPEKEKHEAIYPESGGGYIRLFYIPPEYDIATNTYEELTIKFLTTTQDGLLWHNMDGSTRSYIYLKNGDLWFGSQNGNGPHTTQRITISQNLRDGRDHVLVMRSGNGNVLTYTLDGSEVKRMPTNNRVRFLTDDFNVGGHKNASSVTGNTIRSSFVGIIMDVKLNGSSYPREFDIFREMWAENFPDYVRTSCDMKFERPIAFICDRDELAITFLENNTYISETSWSNKRTSPTLEVKFTTVEPRGLLLFTGARLNEYFALEVFDGLLYLATDVGRGPVHLLVSPGLVTDNKPHTAKFVFNTDEQNIDVFFDGMRRENVNVPLTNVRSGKNTLFDGQVFLGGYPNYGNLPWHIWSQSGFVGCVQHLKINTISSELGMLYKDQGALNIVEGCQPFIDYCSIDQCQNNAPCSNRKDSYYCDCTGLMYADYENDVCARLTLIGNINGSTYYDIDLGRNIKTHVNDFSTRFKTIAESGTMWMTHSPTSQEYIKVFFEDGDLKVEVYAGGRREVTTLEGQYNDYEWHTLNIRRRADDMYVWVDDKPKTRVDLSSDDFYIYMNTIRLGANIPDAGPPPYFFGHLSNFRWPPGTDRKIPFIDVNTIMPIFYPITFLTPDAYIRLRNKPDEMNSMFKVLVMIKTKQRDSLFLYQAGQRGQYLAGLLNNGKLNVRFNFGDGDEMVPVTNKFLSDDQWHMIEIYRKSPDKISIKVDQSLPVEKGLSESAVKFDHSETMYIGGIPGNIILPNGLRSFYTSGYKGCMASLVKASKLIDIGNENLQDPKIRAAGSVVRQCRDQPTCESSKCLNGCVCSDTASYCDNSLIPARGPFCEIIDIGFRFFDDNEPGQVTLIYDPAESTSMDKISFAFKSCRPDGLLAKISGENENEQIKIFLEGGAVAAEYRLGGAVKAQLKVNGNFDDQQRYTVQFVRDGQRAELKVLDSSPRPRTLGTTDTFLSGGDEELNGIRRLEIGSELQNGGYENAFEGVMFGFKHNKYEVFSLASSLTRWANVKKPGTSYVKEDSADVLECNQIGDCGYGKPECKNFGVCQNNHCNCTLTAYKGAYCTEEPHGHYYGFNNWESGIAVHEYPRGVTTQNDYFAIGLMTYEQNGTIFRVQNTDGSQYYDFRLVNGKARLEYRLKDKPEFIEEDRIILNSREHVYHVIRMNRTGENITFFVDDLQKFVQDPNIAGVQFKDQQILMSGGMVNERNTIVDDWNGILAGLYYNNKFMYHLTFDSNTYRKFGDVELAPHPFRLRFQPDPKCPTCNRGVKLGDGSCDCMYTGMAGICCETLDGLWGFHTKKHGGDTVIIYDNSSMVGSSINDLSVSFRTAKGWEDGQIVRVESKDGTEYISVEILNDIILVRHNIGGDEKVEEFLTVDVRDQNDHIVRIHRNGRSGYIELDNIKRGISFPSNKIFDANIIYVGGKYNGAHVTSGHYGIIWGINYNGLDIVEATRGGMATENGIRLVTVQNGEGNFGIIPYPWPALCAKGSLDPMCNPALTTPSAPGGAGGIIPEIGGGNPVVPVPVAQTGGIPTSTGALIGAVMGGLLFMSAIAFAAAGMKPGFIAFSKKFAGGLGKGGAYIPVTEEKLNAFPVSKGGGGGGNYLAMGLDEYGNAKGGGSQVGSRSQYEESFIQESQFDAADASAADAVAMNGGVGGGGGGFNTINQSSSWYTRNETLENQAGYGGGSTIGGYGAGRGGGYAGSAVGGSVAGSVYGFGTVTNPDQAFITLSEDIAVDNVVLTADGRYVVTGSNLGPPQVWNTTNGEMVTTMRGDFMGSTGLHLAANEQYLIGETMAEQAAVDMNDIQTGNHIPLRRVAVWDFNTGNPLPIAVDQLCTASCVSKDGYKVVMAMTDKFGGGTTVRVLDLLSNQVLHEATYPETIGVADSASCVFISPDDRFVAVGFTNSFDNNANFIVFDLFNKTGVVDSPIVALNADPNCTVILNHDEALTGTKNGELVIWSMKTGKAQRQLTSGDVTMLSQGGMPAAHEREVKEVALSDDGKYLASASADRTVKIWNMETESLLHTLHGHNDEVWTVDIASDNSIIVSGSQDGTIKLWRLRNGNQVTSFNATMDIFHARFSKDKKTVVALGDKHGARKLIMLQIVSQKKWRMKSS